VETATLTSKSQITLPKAVREALGAEPGDKVQFVPAWQGYRLVVLKGDITRMRGVLKGQRAKPLSIEAMNAAIARMGSRPEIDASPQPKATTLGKRRR
jgi:antitoxin PrlF